MYLHGWLISMALVGMDFCVNGSYGNGHSRFEQKCLAVIYVNNGICKNNKNTNEIKINSRKKKLV